MNKEYGETYAINPNCTCVSFGQDVFVIYILLLHGKQNESWGIMTVCQELCMYDSSLLSHEEIVNGTSVQSLPLLCKEKFCMHN